MAKQTTSAPRSSAPSRPKPSAPRAAAAEAVGRKAPSIVTFVQESRAELRKVTWPTRQETINLTVAVIVMTVGIALFLGLMDYILELIIKPLIGAK